MWRTRLTIDCRINHFGHRGSSGDLETAREAEVLNYAPGFGGCESIFQGDRTNIHQCSVMADIGITMDFGSIFLVVDVQLVLLSDSDMHNYKIG